MRQKIRHDFCTRFPKRVGKHAGNANIGHGHTVLDPILFQGFHADKPETVSCGFTELEFMNALLSDRLTLARRKQFGSSSEKYADGYTQMNLFNEAEREADPNAAEPEMEEIHPKSYKR